MSRPQLSIVTITRNNADGLASTLRSVQEQSAFGDRVEIVVVDGASTDRTADVIANDAPAGAIAVSEPDDGVYDAMNKGVGLSSGTWLQFLNAGDTFSDAGALGAVLDALDRADGASWLVAGAVHLGGGALDRPILIRNQPYHRVRHLFGLQAHCHQSTFVRRTAFDALGGYSLAYDFAGDFDLIVRLAADEPPAELDRVVVAYEGGGMSADRRDEIPMLLHRVRIDRLGLGPLRAGADLAWTRGRQSYARTRARLGSRRSTSGAPSSSASRDAR